jgi:hypothetical protein
MACFRKPAENVYGNGTGKNHPLSEKPEGPDRGERTVAVLISLPAAFICSIEKTGPIQYKNAVLVRFFQQLIF